MQDTKLNTAFLESYSQNFARQLTDTFFSQQEYISGKEITAFSDIIQVNLLVLDSLFTNWQQEITRLRSPYFNYEAAEVKEVLEHFMNVLSRHIHVNRFHFEPLVAKAVAATLRLALAPYSFFEGIFREIAQHSLTLDALKSRSKFFQFNKFLFQETVQRLESQPNQDVSLENLMLAFDGVFAARQEELEKPEVIIELFSRHAPLSLADLQRTDEKPQPTAQQSFWVDIEQFALAASQPQQTAAPATTPVINTPAGITPLVHEPEEIKVKPISPEPAHPMPINPEPVNPTPINPEPVSVPPVLPPLNESFAQAKVTLNERFQGNTSSSLADRHQKQRIDNIRSAISLNQRFVFVKGLFQGDSAAFHQALNDLEQCTDYPSACQLLQDKYGTPYGWDQESEEVQAFLDLIERKF